MILDEIHTEHGYIGRLLTLLQQKLAAIRNGQEVNYSLIKDIVSYLQNHAQYCHHPKEDVLYHYYQAHYADEAEQMESLEKEHEKLAELTHEFADTVDMILMDAVIPLDVFADKLNTFVDCQKAHLEFEERKILPLIRLHFTPEDWQTVSELYEKCDSDPLFGNQVSDCYRHLAQRLHA
ncbi:hemerythrin domain-containing protein [Photobacterium nomapromontoriensis]|uniref:hemerythrin domain-containing protein n=1 Tax=Photobacterium nomapromontoriensis TaxID=2910237 RepID=UPI003D144802